MELGREERVCEKGRLVVLFKGLFLEAGKKKDGGAELPPGKNRAPSEHRESFSW